MSIKPGDAFPDNDAIFNSEYKIKLAGQFMEYRLPSTKVKKNYFMHSMHLNGLSLNLVFFS